MGSTGGQKHIFEILWRTKNERTNRWTCRDDSWNSDVDFWGELSMYYISIELKVKWVFHKAGILKASESNWMYNVSLGNDSTLQNAVLFFE